MLIAAAHSVQTALRAVLHAVGAIGDVAGQPAWPLASRIAVENLLIDRGLARHVGIALAMTIAAGVLLIAAIAVRRARWPFVVAGVAMVVMAPWPASPLLWTPAVPTSFHRSTTGFDSASIERGMSVYASQCQRCHGTDGRGEGPDAAALGSWPPTVSGSLLWKRAEGELFWHVRQGVGAMPGFGGKLADEEIWAVLDAMKALAAGDGVRRQAGWSWPLRAPDLPVHCDGRPADLNLSSWPGQRLRLVLAGGALPQPIEDPRFITVVVGAGADTSGADCIASSTDAWSTYARLAGADAHSAAGLQFIVDRDGWLRALKSPDRPGWSEDDLLCRADGGRSPSASGLDALVARIDADPVRVSRLGLPHANAVSSPD